MYSRNIKLRLVIKVATFERKLWAIKIFILNFFLKFFTLFYFSIYCHQTNVHDIILQKE